jgi:hypothetical protein
VSLTGLSMDTSFAWVKWKNPPDMGRFMAWL